MGRIDESSGVLFYKRHVAVPSCQKDSSKKSISWTQDATCPQGSTFPKQPCQRCIKSEAVGYKHHRLWWIFMFQLQTWLTEWLNCKLAVHCCVMFSSTVTGAQQKHNNLPFYSRKYILDICIITIIPEIIGTIFFLGHIAHLYSALSDWQGKPLYWMRRIVKLHYQLVL